MQHPLLVKASWLCPCITHTPIPVSPHITMVGLSKHENRDELQAGTSILVKWSIFVPGGRAKYGILFFRAERANFVFVEDIAAGKLIPGWADIGRLFTYYERCGLRFGPCWWSLD